MPNPVSLFSWLVFGQGILLSAAILVRRNYRSNIFLGIFLVLLSIHGLTAASLENPVGAWTPELILLLNSLPFLYGPLIYRYVWHLVYSDFNDPVPMLIHAFPALAAFTVYLGLYLYLGRETVSMITLQVISGEPPWYVKIIEGGKIIQGIFYCFLIAVLFYRHRQGLRRFASVKLQGRWLVSMLGIFSLNWLLVLVSTLLLWTVSWEDLYSLMSTIQLIAFLIFIYTVTAFSLRYPAVLEPKEVREEIRKKLNLPEGFIDETLSRLRKAEAELFFTDSEVTLVSLAARLGLHPNALSFIINEKEGTGFREYLNRLRLEYFLERASNPANAGNRLELAFDSGFSSKTTFLRAFRRQYGTTPGEYLENLGTDFHT